MFANQVLNQKTGIQCFKYFEQGARHSFQEKTGKDIANPTAILLCAANMLKHLRMDELSDKIKNAVQMTIKSGKVSLGFNKQCC